MASTSFDITIRTATNDAGDDIVLPKQHPDCTVRLLRQAVANQHPCRPRVNQIRLIYCGHMLRDDETLKHIVRKNSESTSFVFHLVLSGDALSRSLSSPSSQPSTSATPDSTLRHRHHEQPPNTPFTPSPLASRQSSTATSPYAHYYYQYYQHQMSQSPQYAQAVQQWYLSQGLTPPTTPTHATSAVTHTPPAATVPAVTPADRAPADPPLPAGAGADLPEMPDQGNRFAQAGVGAAPMIDPGDGDAQQAQPIAGPAQYLLMMGKLALLILMFGQGASTAKLSVLIGIAFIIFLAQCGVFTLRRANRARAQAQAPEEFADDTSADGDAVQTPQPPSLVAGIGEVVTTFFSSMVPPMAEAY